MIEMVGKIKSTNENIDYVLPPIEMISGRAYVSFTVKEKGKKKESDVPMLLSRCPICGKKYEKKEDKR